MAEIDDLLKKWMDSAPESAPKEPPKHQANAAQGSSSGSASPDLAALLPMLMSMLGGAGGKNDQASNLMSTILPALGELSGEDDTTRLLKALKPFMNQRRSANMDTAVTAARVMRVARAATKPRDAKEGDKNGP